jgi:hypothetical protein
VRYYPGWYWQKKLTVPTWYYATPWAHIDGTSRDYNPAPWDDSVRVEEGRQSDLTMSLSGWFNPSSRQGRINIHIVNANSQPLSKTYIRCAMTENVGSVKQALRKFYSNGADTLRMQAGDTVTIAGNATLDRQINFWTRPSWNADSCRLVVFIQKDSVITGADTTKPIYQGAKVWIRTLPSGVETSPIVESSITEVWLSAAEPTPFKDRTRISFSLPLEGSVSLGVYNLLGARVRTLVSGTKPAGSHSATWDGRDEKGFLLPGGVYFFELKTPYKSLTTRTVVVR